MEVVDAEDLHLRPRVDRLLDLVWEAYREPRDLVDLDAVLPDVVGARREDDLLDVGQVRGEVGHL